MLTKTGRTARPPRRAKTTLMKPASCMAMAMVIDTSPRRLEVLALPVRVTKHAGGINNYIPNMPKDNSNIAIHNFKFNLNSNE